MCFCMRTAMLSNWYRHKIYAHLVCAYFAMVDLLTYTTAPIVIGILPLEGNPGGNDPIIIESYNLDVNGMTYFTFLYH